MNTTNYIRIFRGDDSDALGYQTIVGTIKTDLDLTGCKAVFRFLGFYAEFNPIPEDKKLTIVIPAQASRGFPPGVGYASLKVFDSLGKIRTFTNRIPVIVDTMTPSCGCGEFEVSFSPFPELEPLKIFIGPNADDFDQYTGFVSKIIDRASLVKYGLAILADAMSEDGGASGMAASPLAVKAAYDAILGMLADNYYNKEQTDEQIDKLAAYYITADAQGNPFATHAALVNATTYYSGGGVRVPTRNDYAIVKTDETHNNEEWRYIYSENAQGVGQWEPQYAVEGVIAYDNTVTPTSANGVKSSGIWSALWGALSALPTGFTSLYDWCVSQLAPKVARTELFPAWAANTAYTTYSLVIHENAVYKCTTAHTSGAEWDSTKWGAATGADVLGVLLNYLALTNKPQINGNTLTGESSQSGADLGLLDLAGGTMTGDLNVGDPDHYANILAHGNITANGGLYATSLDLQPAYGEYLDIVRVGNTWVIRITHGNTVAQVSIPLSDGAMALLQNIADDFDSSDSYSKNALCIYNGTLCRCINENGHTGDWDAADFAPATVEDVLAALRTGKQDALSAQQLANIAAVPNKANASDLRYSLGTPTIISSASSEVVSGETVHYGAATLADRTANQVFVVVALDELRVTIPPAVLGKVRDFGLLVAVGADQTALAAPALVPIAPTGETITMMNADGEMPTLADGTTTSTGSTVLYFTEIANGVFLVKGEQVEEVA